MGFQADHLRLYLLGKLSVDVLEIRGFSSSSRAVIYNLDLDNLFPEIDKTHLGLLILSKIKSVVSYWPRVS